MGKSIRGFRSGADFQVQYPKGGDSNILQGRNQGRIIRTGVGKKGPYVFIKYRDNRTMRNRIATLSVAKMINPIVFQENS